MQPLDRTLRNQLERTIKDARDTAEEAARIALQQLGVGEPKPHEHLKSNERDLRQKLRVHGRQLGDKRDPITAIQEITFLTEELAYEHWHRMLFARFLAENNLLMYPDPQNPVPVTLEECEELAAEEGASNGWELAARFATQMLPQIFRVDSPVFRLHLPPEHQHALEKLLDTLPREVFAASDSLGWVYQFWQAKRKDAINASEVKIGARELPAVTQLFTEPYMVSFLLDNALGAWWVGKLSGMRKEGIGELKPGARNILQSAETEAELRQFFCLPGVPLEYLRFIKGEEGCWQPAAGWFEGWPEHLKELTTLDPACGSGHFLVAAFLMLAPMRIELEQLSAREACDAVLKDNLHGLDIDPRVVEISAFNLALTAWRFPEAGGYRVLPELQVACSGLPITAKKQDWLDLARRAADEIVKNKDNTLFPDPKKETIWHNRLISGMEQLYDLFKQAPLLGSLINPRQIKADLFRAEFDHVSGLLNDALSNEKGLKNDEYREMAVIAQGLSKAANLMANKYFWIITNVPYLARGKQNDELKEYFENHYNESKNDIATVFLQRGLEYCNVDGNISIVTPQNWLFLTTYKKLREQLLRNETFNLIARLGPGAFETISGHVVKAVLLNVSKNPPRINQIFAGIDVSELNSADEKASSILFNHIKLANQDGQLKNPDSIISFETSHQKSLLGKYVRSLAGLDNGDTLQFRCLFWELPNLYKGWIYQINSPNRTTFYTGCEHILKWEDGNGKLVECPGARLSNIDLWGTKGIYVSRMQNLPSTICNRISWDRNGALVAPKTEEHIVAIWEYVSSDTFLTNVRKLNQKLSVAETTFEKVGFDLEYWQKVANEKYPNGLPKPYSDDPTQWIFHGHPCGSVVWDENTKWTAYGPIRTDETVLQVAVARLLGYRWPAETDTEMELADEQREWVNKARALLPFSDQDGIVCIPVVRGEASAAERLLNLLAAAYGDQWSNTILSELLNTVGYSGKTLENWLREAFFTQHCKMFHHRPFIWHIWDGLNDGFAVLLNYHKLNRKNLETVIYTYLGDWITRQKDEIKSMVDGAYERLAAAENLKKKLELILHGEEPYDIFVRWKHLHEQPIGWEPDLNDGVRLNIRPFMSVPDVRKKGAGVLRDKPNIDWKKDRGKDVESAPWYHLGVQFGGNYGDRINDHHLKLSTKQAAREKQKKEASK